MNNETNAVEVFNNEEFGSVRTTMINGEPWFVAVDVCKALEIDATATRRLDENEKNTLCLTQGTRSIALYVSTKILVIGNGSDRLVRKLRKAFAEGVR